MYQLRVSVGENLSQQDLDNNANVIGSHDRTMKGDLVSDRSWSRPWPYLFILALSSARVWPRGQGGGCQQHLGPPASLSISRVESGTFRDIKWNLQFFTQTEPWCAGHCCKARESAPIGGRLELPAGAFCQRVGGLKHCSYCMDSLQEN